MTLLTTTIFPDVRALLDLSLDERSLPDSVIQLNVFGHAAERELLVAYPDAEDDPNQDSVLHALALLTASKIAPSLPSIVREHTETHQIERARVDYAVLGDQLRAQALEVLGTLQSAVSVTEIPVFFTVASGYRGR
jgi:hypothetical protein